MAGTVTELQPARSRARKPATSGVTSVPSVPSGLRKPRAPRTSRAADQRLAAKVRDHYKTYVMFHSDLYEAQVGLLTLFTLHTYTWDLASHTPYFLVQAPTSESGKSTVFDVAGLLVFNPFLVADPSAAGLYNAIDELHPCILVDEADMLKHNKGLTVVLNAGFQRNGPPIIRTNRRISCFCPKMFAGIAGEKPPLTGAAGSRCLPIVIRRKSAKETLKFRVKKFDLDDAMDEMAPTQKDLMAWAKRSREKLRRPKVLNVPKELSDRQQDMCKQLFAIADLLGGAWPKNARKWAVEIFKSVPRQVDPGIQILADVKAVLDGFTGEVISTRELAERRNKLDAKQYEDILTAQQLGRRLSAFGMYTAQWRTGKGTERVRGYKFRNTKGVYLPEWADAFERYRVGTNTSEH